MTIVVKHICKGFIIPPPNESLWPTFIHNFDGILFDFRAVAGPKWKWNVTPTRLGSPLQLHMDVFVRRDLPYTDWCAAVIELLPRKTGCKNSKVTNPHSYQVLTMFEKQCYVQEVAIKCLFKRKLKFKSSSTFAEKCKEYKIFSSSADSIITLFEHKHDDLTNNLGLYVSLQNCASRSLSMQWCSKIVRTWFPFGCWKVEKLL